MRRRVNLKPPRPRRPEGRNWERNGVRMDQPWNSLHVEMRLYVAPRIKERLNLDCQTTVEYLKEIKGASHEPQGSLDRFHP